MNGHKPRWSRRSAFVLTVIIVVAIFLQIWDGRSLISKSQRVVASGVQSPGNSLHPVGWLTEREVLAYRFRDGLPTVVCAIDVQSQKERPLGDLASAICRQHSLTPWGTHSQLSPDRQWLMWGSWGGSLGPAILVASIDRARVTGWKPVVKKREWYDPIWSSDSRAWYGFHHRAGKLSTIDKHELVQSTVRPICRTGNTSWLTPLCALPSGDIIASLEDNKSFAKVSLTPSGWAAAPYEIQSPRNSYLMGVALNPKTPRLAWMFAVSHIGNESAFERVLIMLYQCVDDTAYLFTSDLDGTGMHEIGRFNGMFFASHGGDRVNLCGWSPEGKQIAFEAIDALYTIVVNDEK
jgi:hypothetical protein